jgi:hypothetical protein
VDEIRLTLDGRGELENLPFMPEMLKHCGQAFTVTKRADKTCGPDTDLRRMRDTVFLSNVRCDGYAHGGCQAACLLHWKEAWLTRIDSPGTSDSHLLDHGDRSAIEEMLQPATTNGHGQGDDQKDVSWSCQATELRRASTRLRGWQLGQYGRDARNWGVIKVVRTLLVEAFNRTQKMMGRHLPSQVLLRDGRTYPFIAGTVNDAPVIAARLDLQPGDRVRIKSKPEIEQTLDQRNHTRGLSFDAEMVKYCGRIATVRARVNRVIDENTGKMLEIKSDCIILDNVVCRADYHRLCARGIYPYWREAWLERVN